MPFLASIRGYFSRWTKPEENEFQRIVRDLEAGGVWARFPPASSIPIQPDSPADAPVQQKPAPSPETTMATASNILTSVLSAVENPEDLALIAAFGNFLSIFAAHNKNHLGSSAPGVAEAGSTVSQTAALFSTLGSVLGKPTPPA